MSNLILLYDVSDINALLERDIAQTFYRLYGGVERPDDGLSPHDVVECWYWMVLDEEQKVLFSLRPRTNILMRLGAELYNSLSVEVHPAYRRLVSRMITIPYVLSHQEASGLKVVKTGGNQEVLKIIYPNTKKKELGFHACHSTHHQLGCRPSGNNELLLSPSQFGYT
tara:strand:- start:6231 stop:6734 length:504 start_codon:yes stop_codon:yes gene_type:complete